MRSMDWQKMTSMQESKSLLKMTMLALNLSKRNIRRVRRRKQHRIKIKKLIIMSNNKMRMSRQKRRNSISNLTPD